MNTGGQTLRELAGPNGLTQRADNGSDIQTMSGRLSIKNSRGNTPEDIAAKTFKATVFARMFGGASEGALFNEINLEINKNIDAMSATDRQKMGVSIQMLGKRIGHANHQLLSMREGTDNKRYRMIQDEIQSLQIAQETIRKSLIENSILNSEGKPINLEAEKTNFFTLQEGYHQNKTDKVQYIYRANTNVEKANMFQLAKEGILEYVGAVVPGKTFPVNGKNHVVFRNPIDAISMSNKNAIYGISWLKATADRNINSVSENLGVDPLNLSSDVLQLKRDLRDSFSYSLKAGLANPNRSIRGWENQSAYENNRLGEFFEKYTKDLMPDEARDLRQDLALLLLSPDAANNANINAKEAGFMPFFKTNNRLHKATFNYLNKTGELRGTEIAERINWVERNYSYIVGSEVQPSQDIFNKEGINLWSSHLAKHGNAQSLMRSIFRNVRGQSYLPATLYNRLIGIQGKAKFSSGRLFKEGVREEALMFWMSPNAISNYIGRVEASDRKISNNTNCR